MRLRLIALAAFCLITRTVAAQLRTSPDANPIGTWRGTTSCAERTPTCKDETVVYRIIQKGTKDSLSVDERTVVNGQDENVKFMACELNAPRAYISCDVPNGKWRLRARHDSLFGQLRARDGTLLLEMHALRCPCSDSPKLEDPKPKRSETLPLASLRVTADVTPLAT